jgi:effector-binding domain-containing protein
MQGQARLVRVEARLRQIEQKGRFSDYEVVLKKIAPVMIASARQVVPAISDMHQYRRRMFALVYDWLAQHALKAVASELVIYSNTEYTEQDIDTEVAVVVDKASLRSHISPIVGSVSVRELPAALPMASVIHQGSLHAVGQAISALFAWIGVNGYSACGAEREVHLFGREHDLNPSAPVVLEMQIPVEKNTPTPI